MPSPAPIGLQIKRARERLHMTQAELGAAVRKSQKTIDNWEHDRAYPKSSIGALEAGLGISLDAPAGPEPLSEKEREGLTQEYLRLGRILFGSEQERAAGGGSADGGAEGGREGNARSEGRSA